MAAELRLNVALDLAYFRQQLPKLSQAAAGFSLPIKVKFDARQIRYELNKIAARDFRININDTAIKTARTNTQKLKNSLDLLQRQAYQVKIKYVEEGKPGNLPSTRSGARTTGGVVRSLNAAQTRSLYEAALSKGLVKDIARTNAKELQAELIRGLSEAGQQGIAGLVKGIEAGKGAMKGVAAEVGNDFIASLKQVWQIASPSKKTEKIGEQLGEGLEIGVVNGFGEASDAAVRKMREMFNRLKGEAKAGTAGLSALMMGMMSGVVPMGGQRGARGSIGPLIRQQRTAVQGQRQAQAASQVTPSFLAALPLLMGMRQDELTSRLQGLYGQQYQAPVMGGRAQPRPGRIANLLSALAAGSSGVGAGGALSGRLFSGGLANPGIAATGYIGRSALSARYVNYPPGMPAAYGTGFIGGGSGNFSMGGSNQLALPSAEMRQAAQDLRFAARALQAQARGGSTGGFFGAPPPGGGRGPQPMLGPGGGGGGGPTGRIPMSGFGGPNGAFGRNLLSGQAGIIGDIADEFANATKQVLLFGTAYKALAAITSFPAQVANAVGKLQSFNNQLDAVTGGGRVAEQSIALIESTVAKMNIPLDSARQGFVKLYASMRPAGIDAGTINNIFTGVASAAATFGMSSDQVDRMTNSLAQMASKGQIMAEELKGQLGDVFPQAVSLFAKAAGYLDDSMTDIEKSEGIAKFLKAMEDGTFKGKAMQQMLKNVGILLNQDFGPSAVKAGESFNNQLNKLNNALQKFYEAFAPAAGAFLGEFVTPITNGLKVVSDAAKLALSGDALGGNQLAAYFRNELFPQLVNVKNGLLTAAKTVADFAGALGVVLRPLAQFVLGNKELVTVVARAVTIFALYRAGMAAANAVGLIPLIRSIVNYNQVFRIFVAQSMQGATSMQALQVAAARTGMSMNAAAKGVGVLGTAIRTMVTTTIIGFALVAISMLIQKIQELQATADRIRNIKPGMVSRLRGAAQAGGATGLQSEQRTVQAELQRKERMAANLRTLQSGGTVSKAAIDELESQGLNVRGMTFQTPGGRIAPQYTMRGAPGMEEAVVNPELSRLAGQVTAEAQAARQGYQAGMGLAGRDAAVVDARTAAQSGIKVGDFVGGDGGGKAEKGRESQVPILQERLNLATDLAKIEAEIGQAQILQQDIEVMRLETEKELRQIKFEIAEVMLDKETPAAEKQLKVAELQVKEEQTRKKLRDEIQKKIITDLLKHKDALDDIKSKSEGELRNRQRYAELLAKGLRPEQARLTIEVENQFRELEKVLKLERERLRIQVDILKAKKAAGEKIDEAALKDLEDALRKYDERIGQLPSEGKAELDRRTEADKPLDRATRLREIMSEAEAEFKKLIDPVNLLVGAAETFRDAFANAFADLVTGAISAQQALANVFKSIGDYFVQMAGRMIAQWLFMKAIGLVQSIFGASAGVTSPAAPAPTDGGIVLAANGGIMRGGWAPVTPFADGGMVTGPTLGLVGEGRFNEAVVPLPNGKSIPVELGGAAGNSIATNITVNVNNGQAQSEMSGSGGNRLGRELDAAVKDVILREVRPGGIIYSSRR